MNRIKYIIGLKRRCGISVTSFCFLFFPFFLNASVDPGDSIRKNYSLDDPRNPACPCHAYQKRAEKEFASILKKEQEDSNKLNKSLKKYLPRIKTVKNRTSFNKRRSFTHTPKENKNKRRKNLLNFHFRRDITSCPHY